MECIKSTGAYPDVDNDGLVEGRPKSLSDFDLHKLNIPLDTVGFAERVVGLQKLMMDNMTKASQRRDMCAIYNTPSRSSLDRYHAKATMLDNNIILVQTAFSMQKTSRRQMASTSFKNLMSHISAVAYSIFSPCVTRWEHFYKASLGAQELMTIIQSVTGVYVKPIHPEFLLNEDCSSRYFFSGKAPNTSKDKSYLSVNVAAIDDRNRSSIWINTDSTEEPCSCIRIKFACGDSAAGYIYPICILLSGLSDAEISKQDFIVVPIEGLGINGRIDPRNKEVVYVCLMKHNV